MKILVNSCIRGLDSIGMSESRKFCALGTLEYRRHAVSKIIRAVSMKVTIENCERRNIAAEF